MPGRQYVYILGTTYWFRRRFKKRAVGRWVKDQQLGREFKRSLRVSRLTEIEAPLALALAEFNELEDLALNRRRAAGYRESRADVTQPRRSMADLHIEDTPGLLANWFAREWGVAPERMSDEEARKAIKSWRDEIDNFAQSDEGSYDVFIQGEAANELLRQGFELDRAHAVFLHLADLMARAKVHALKRNIAIIEGRKLEPASDPELAELIRRYETRSVGRQGVGRTFGALVEAFMRDRSHKPLSPATRREDEVLARVLREIVGSETKLTELSPERCLEVRELFTQLPANYTKLYPGVRIADIPARSKRDGRDPMSPKTANKYLEFLGAAFKYGHRRLKWLTDNPAEGLRLGVDKSIDRHFEPYTREQLQKLFRAPIFTGCKDAKAGALIPGAV